ncbi:MAG: thymidine phosphorylase, partial [Gemmatimonadales bacterium]
VVEDPSILPQANEVEVFRAPKAGTVAQVEPRRIGFGVIELGGGRARKEDTVDPSVGFVITARPGDKVVAGEPIASIFARDRAGIEHGLSVLTEAITFGPPVPLLPLVSHRLSKDGTEVLGQ